MTLEEARPYIAVQRLAFAVKHAPLKGNTRHECHSCHSTAPQAKRKKKTQSECIRKSFVRFGTCLLPR